MTETIFTERNTRHDSCRPFQLGQHEGPAKEMVRTKRDVETMQEQRGLKSIVHKDIHLGCDRQGQLDDRLISKSSKMLNCLTSRGKVAETEHLFGVVVSSMYT